MAIPMRMHAVLMSMCFLRVGLLWEPGESVCELHVMRAGLHDQDGFALHRHARSDCHQAMNNAAKLLRYGRLYRKSRNDQLARCAVHSHRHVSLHVSKGQILHAVTSIV